MTVTIQRSMRPAAAKAANRLAAAHQPRDALAVAQRRGEVQDRAGRDGHVLRPALRQAAREHVGTGRRRTATRYVCSPIHS